MGFPIRDWHSYWGGVLAKRCGLFFGRQDVFVNVVGAVRLDNTRGSSGDNGSTSDLAAAMALVSSLLSIAVRSDTAFCGEIGLLGELRPVAGMEKRMQEARRMGFSRVVGPPSYNNKQGPGKYNNRAGKGGKGGQPTITTEHGIERIQCQTLLQALNAGLVRELPKKQPRKTKEGGSTTSRSAAPGNSQDLQLDNIIMDDGDDDDDWESRSM